MRPLRGGAATAVHAIDVVGARGRRRRLVLRRFVLPNWQQPEHARREARVLEVVGRSALPAPELVAFDAEERHCDVPAVLMTRLSGRLDLTPNDMSAWLRQMAEWLPRIHELTGPDSGIPAYRRYHDVRFAKVPPWTKRPGLWARVIELAQRRRPRSPRGLIHRDYHPANVLWSRGKLSAIVDWTNASIGPVEVDIAHCRRNLVALHGVKAADAFLAYRLAALGRKGDEYDPYWDANALTDIDLASGTHVYPGWIGTGPTGLSPAAIARRLDAFAASIVARG